MQDPLQMQVVLASWELVRERVQASEPVEPPELRAALRRFDSQWSEQELSLAVELAGFAYGRVLDAAKSLAADVRRGRRLNDEVARELRWSDDVLDATHALFAVVNTEEEYATGPMRN